MNQDLQESARRLARRYRKIAGLLDGEGSKRAIDAVALGLAAAQDAVELGTLSSAAQARAAIGAAEEVLRALAARPVGPAALLPQHPKDPYDMLPRRAAKGS